MLSASSAGPSHSCVVAEITPRRKKKADVIEYPPRVLVHVGLLTGGPPGSAELSCVKSSEISNHDTRTRNPGERRILRARRYSCHPTIGNYWDSPVSMTPDWSWLFGREDNPWYSTMQIFR
jgi:hypothetical protein